MAKSLEHALVAPEASRGAQERVLAAARLRRRGATAAAAAAAVAVLESLDGASVREGAPEAGDRGGQGARVAVHDLVAGVEEEEEEERKEKSRS